MTTTPVRLSSASPIRSADQIALCFRLRRSQRLTRRFSIILTVAFTCPGPPLSFAAVHGGAERYFPTLHLNGDLAGVERVIIGETVGHLFLDALVRALIILGALPGVALTPYTRAVTAGSSEILATPANRSSVWLPPPNP